jgi:DNA-binding XRE family transcriptional regulator
MLVEDAEMLADVRDYDASLAAVAGGEELVPAEVVYTLLDGANPIRVWREHRGLSQGELAAKAGISPSYLSQLESGKRDGTTEVLSAIAAVLEVAIDDLIGS